MTLPDSKSSEAAGLTRNGGKIGDRDEAESHIWRRSSRCGTHGSCVEISDLGRGTVGIRDGKIPETSAVLVFDSAAWLAFVSGVKAGEFS